MTGTQTDASRRWLSIQRTYPCARCGAKPGERCRTSAGKFTNYPHADRYYQTRANQWKGAGA